MTYLRIIVLICLTTFIVATSVQPATACPMCQAANEDGDVDEFDGNQAMTSVPRAYMFSILFMLAVPVGLATSFGVGFYRLSRRDDLADSPTDGLS